MGFLVYLGVLWMYLDVLGDLRQKSVYSCNAVWYSRVFISGNFVMKERDVGEWGGVSPISTSGITNILLPMYTVAITESSPTELPNINITRIMHSTSTDVQESKSVHIYYIDRGNLI